MTLEQQAHAVDPTEYVSCNQARKIRFSLWSYVLPSPATVIQATARSGLHSCFSDYIIDMMHPTTHRMIDITAAAAVCWKNIRVLKDVVQKYHQ